MSTLLPWFVTAILCLVTFVWGEARRSEREQARYSKLVGDDASQRTALRMLYAATGYEMPDLWETPEQQPTRWDRLVAWVVARFRGPAPIEEKTEKKPAATEENEWDEADYRRQADTDMARLVERIEQVRAADTGPTTEPEIPAVPGPATVPSGMAIADDWAVKSDALYQQMLAEIRGETEKETA